MYFIYFLQKSGPSTAGGQRQQSAGSKSQSRAVLSVFKSMINHNAMHTFDYVSQ